MNERLPDRILKSIIRVCRSHESIDKLYLFGSRARGDHRYNSDIDLAVDGKDLTEEVRSDLDEACELFYSDIVFINQCKNDRLLDEISSESIMLYSKDH